MSILRKMIKFHDDAVTVVVVVLIGGGGGGGRGVGGDRIG